MEPEVTARELSKLISDALGLRALKYVIWGGIVILGAGGVAWAALQIQKAVNAFGGIDATSDSTLIYLATNALGMIVVVAILGLLVIILTFCMAVVVQIGVNGLHIRRNRAEREELDQIRHELAEATIERLEEMKACLEAMEQERNKGWIQRTWSSLVFWKRATDD